MFEALTSIAAEPVLPDHLGKIDPLKPRSWLTDAAIAVGAGAMSAGLDTLLRKDTGMREAALGGNCALQLRN